MAILLDYGVTLGNLLSNRDICDTNALVRNPLISSNLHGHYATVSATETNAFGNI